MMLKSLIKKGCWILAFAGILVGCGGEDRGSLPGLQNPPNVQEQDAGDGGGGAPPSTTKCTEGATKDCKVQVGTHNGIVTCFLGTQTCSEGVWQECVIDEL
jgi:hypothetical protein